MKKIFTLMFVVGMFTMAQAQSGTRDNRQADQRSNQQNDQRGFDNGYDKGKVIVQDNNFFDKDSRYNDKFSMERKRDMEIARINQEYDFRIQKVKRSFFMSWFEKQRQIRFLEQQRQREIKMVYVKYTYSRKPYNNRDDRDNHSNGHY